jgi:hypothetical protein
VFFGSVVLKALFLAFARRVSNDSSAGAVSVTSGGGCGRPAWRRRRRAAAGGGVACCCVPQAIAPIPAATATPQLDEPAALPVDLLVRDCELRMSAALD